MAAGLAIGIMAFIVLITILTVTFIVIAATQAKVLVTETYDPTNLPNVASFQACGDGGSGGGVGGEIPATYYAQQWNVVVGPVAWETPAETQAACGGDAGCLALAYPNHALALDAEGNLYYPLYPGKCRLEN